MYKYKKASQRLQVSMKYVWKIKPNFSISLKYEKVLKIYFVCEESREFMNFLPFKFKSHIVDVLGRMFQIKFIM